MFISPALCNEPSLDCLVGRASDPLPVLVEVGVLRVLSRGTVHSDEVQCTPTGAVKGAITSSLFIDDHRSDVVQC